MTGSHWSGEGAGRPGGMHGIVGPSLARQAPVSVPNTAFVSCDWEEDGKFWAGAKLPSPAFNVSLIQLALPPASL